MPDSYFGYIGNSFYAGPNGTSFLIKNNAKFGNYRELLANNDSLILIGDYLLVNYGDLVNPNNPSTINNYSYNENKLIDLNNNLPYIDKEEEEENIPAQLENPGYYNATLWQKTDNNKYELVFLAVSATPNIEINTSTDLVNPGVLNPNIINKKDSSTLDNLVFELKPIKPWNIQKGSDITVSPLNGPTVEINRKENLNSIESDTTKYIHFGIPNAWNFKEEVNVTKVNPNSASFFVSITQADDNNKQLNMQIPNAWDIQKGSDITENVTPASGPQVKIDNEGSNPATTKYIHFGIPDAWNIQKGDDIILYPSVTTQPEVILNSNKERLDPDTTAEEDGDWDSNTKYIHFGIPRTTLFSPPSIKLLDSTKTTGQVEGSYEGKETDLYKLTFSIPRGTKITGGTAFGTGWDDSTELEFSLANDLAALNPGPGDLYINTTYGYLLLIKSLRTTEEEEEEKTYVTLENKGAIQLNGFDIVSFPIDPVYTQNEENSWAIDDSAMDLTGTVTKPNTTSDNWTLNLPVIKPPAFSGTSKIVGSNEIGKIEIKPSSDGKIINYSILIPRGSRIFSSDSAPTSSSGLLPGDYWFNPSTNEFTAIVNDTGGTGRSVSLMGRSFSLYTQNIIEEGVSIVKSRWLVKESELTDSSTTDFTIKVGLWLNNLNVTPLSLNQVVDVLYTDDSDEDNPLSFSYWFYKNENTWYSIRLSASSASSFIVHETTADLNKVYDTIFINRINDRVTTNTTNISSINTRLIDMNTVIATKQNAEQVSTIANTIVDNQLTWGSWNDQGIIE